VVWTTTSRRAREIPRWLVDPARCRADHGADGTQMAPFTIAFFLGPGLLRAFVHLVVGPSPTSPILWQTMPRVEAAQLFAYCAVVIGLTWRFVRERPAPTTFLDRCALTFFAIATLEQALVTYRVPPLPLLSGVMALFIAWVAYHLNRATKRHEHHPHRIGSLDTRS